ncbi:MAG TPA: hypothetical protein VFZ12_09305 [Dehalococcoidia bacterium]|nr:hypothetical protein [Dehalococcoidia bacterium]
MLDQPASNEDYEELAEALDIGTANELLRQGWHLLAVVAGGPVSYVFGKPRMVDLNQLMESTEAILEESAAAEEQTTMQTPLQQRYR